MVLDKDMTLRCSSCNWEGYPNERTLITRHDGSSIACPKCESLRFVPVCIVRDCKHEAVGFAPFTSHSNPACLAHIIKVTEVLGTLIKTLKEQGIVPMSPDDEERKDSNMLLTKTVKGED